MKKVIINIKKPLDLVIDNLSVIVGSTSYCAMPNKFFNHRGNCYDNEKFLYDKITSEAYNIHGVKADYYEVTFSTNNEKVFGEDNDRYIDRVFPIKVYFDTPAENRHYSQFGIIDLDSFEMFITKMLFKQYSKDDYEPKQGDLIRPKYNGVIYEIIEVKDTTEQFLNTQHTWRLLTKVWENNLPSYRPENLKLKESFDSTMDKTNSNSTEPPQKLTSVFDYITNGSDTLKQNELIDIEKQKILYQDKCFSSNFIDIKFLTMEIEAEYLFNYTSSNIDLDNLDFEIYNKNVSCETSSLVFVKGCKIEIEFIEFQLETSYSEIIDLEHENIDLVIGDIFQLIIQKNVYINDLENIDLEMDLEGFEVHVKDSERINLNYLEIYFVIEDVEVTVTKNTLVDVWYNELKFISNEIEVKSTNGVYLEVESDSLEIQCFDSIIELSITEIISVKNSSLEFNIFDFDIEITSREDVEIEINELGLIFEIKKTSLIVLDKEEDLGFILKPKIRMNYYKVSSGFEDSLEIGLEKPKIRMNYYKVSSGFEDSLEIGLEKPRLFFGSKVIEEIEKGEGSIGINTFKDSLEIGLEKPKIRMNYYKVSSGFEDSLEIGLEKPKIRMNYYKVSSGFEDSLKINLEKPKIKFN